MTPGEQAPHPEALVPGTRVGRWRVVEPLGVGGQGAVYLVEDLDQPGVFHALKLALPAHAERAEREVALMRSRAAHSHVVGFHDCVRWPDATGGCLGLLMEWVPGQALDVWAETGDTTFRQLAHLAATVARTLGDLHARGVLHRDLKPEHIRVRASDGQPVLLDLGAGWYEGAVPLTPRPPPPPPPYLLSPEAVRFPWEGPQRPGVRYGFQPTEDLYALGVCLYRATTGHYPFSEWMPTDVLQSAIVHARPQVPRLVNPRVPRALSEVIVRLLEKDASARYSSGVALHAALEEAVQSEDAAWDVSIFAWEEAPAPDGAPTERYLLRPARPRFVWTSEPPVALQVARRRRWPRRLARVVAVGLLLVPMTRLAPGVLEVRGPERPSATEGRPPPTSVATEQAPTPLRNQKQAPCTAKLEVEVSGVCWHSLEQRPPDCPPQTFVYKDKCLWPVPRPQTVPTSVEGGDPKAR